MTTISDFLPSAASTKLATTTPVLEATCNTGHAPMHYLVPQLSVRDAAAAHECSLWQVHRSCMTQLRCFARVQISLPPSVTLKIPLVYFVTVLLIPPQRPLSDVYATVTLFSTSAPAVTKAFGDHDHMVMCEGCALQGLSVAHTVPGMSPNAFSRGTTRPLEFSVCT